MAAVYQDRIFDMPYAWLSLFFLFLANDLAAYWMHRLAHERRVLWADHGVHHVSPHLNLTSRNDSHSIHTIKCRD